MISTILIIWLIKLPYHQWAHVITVCVCVCTPDEKACGWQWFHAPLRLHYDHVHADLFFVLLVTGLWNVTFIYFTCEPGGCPAKWILGLVMDLQHRIKLLTIHPGSLLQTVRMACRVEHLWAEQERRFRETAERNQCTVTGRRRRRRKTHSVPHAWWLMALVCLTHHPGVHPPDSVHVCKLQCLAVFIPLQHERCTSDNLNRLNLTRLPHIPVREAVREALMSHLTHWTSETRGHSNAQD